MTIEAVFDALRAFKRERTGEGLSQADVDGFNAIFDGWKAPQAAPDAQQGAPTQIPLSTSLKRPEAFYGAVRGLWALSQSQVDGFNCMLDAMGKASWPLAFAAYGFATAWHETARTMQPVREAYWLSEDWRKTHLRYFPWYGRGFVQLTWQKNYQRADDELGLGGSLIADADLAMKPEIAAQIIVRGMAEGWFSGKKLADYLPSSGAADIHQFANARQIINALDKAVEIAELALKFQDALAAGEWA